MNATAHGDIMTGAFDSLPARWRQPLEPLRPLLNQVANYPDYFDDPTRPESDKARIDPQWMRFCCFPPAMDGGNLHAWPHPNSQQDCWRPITRHWMGQAIDCWRQGDGAGFIKFIGCLSHMEGDLTQPVHLIDQKLLSELLPIPAQWGNFHYHTSVEAVTGDCGELRPPRLLGTGVDESAWRLAAIHLQDMADCRGRIVPIVQALFAGDEVEAQRQAGPPVTLAAQNTADILYTVLQLASGQISDAERQALAAVDLRDRKPDAEFHDLVYGDAIRDGNRSTPPSGAPIVPAELRLANGQVQRVKGLGMLPHSGMNGPHHCWMRFSLPAGVFNHFEAVVGMHAGLVREGAVEFVVELDGQPAFRSKRRTAQDSAMAVSVAVGKATQLTLKVEDANDGKTFWNNHALWGQPRLVKDR
jgi:hypothetical protein